MCQIRAERKSSDKILENITLWIETKLEVTQEQIDITESIAREIEIRKEKIKTSNRNKKQNGLLKR